jgi:serine/threonine-protein phosphatase PGAM5
MRLFLIRHGHTENVDGEAKLSKKGISEAKVIAKKLNDLKFDKVFTSDLIRSIETVKEFTEDYIPDQRLREVYRVLIGGPEKVGTSEDRKEKDRKRADDFFKEVLKEEGNIAIFCHGNIIRYFLNKILKTEHNIWESLVIDNCSISIIENNEKGIFVNRINLKEGFQEYFEKIEQEYVE